LAVTFLKKEVQAIESPWVNTRIAPRNPRTIPGIKANRAFFLKRKTENKSVKAGQR
jgi:hypothetical protein